MTSPSRRRRIAAAAWFVIAMVVGNGTYDLLMMRAVQEHLARAAMHEAGRGPTVPLSQVMAYSIYDAVWKSMLAGSLILLAGLLTILYVSPRSDVTRGAARHGDTSRPSA